ncbi:universal stress protein [Haladaptatus pallidirubidus]
MTYAQEHEIDLIVMGIRGAGKLTAPLVGSVTSCVLSSGDIPVLVVQADE